MGNVCARRNEAESSRDRYGRELAIGDVVRMRPRSSDAWQCGTVIQIAPLPLKIRSTVGKISVWDTTYGARSEVEKALPWEKVVGIWIAKSDGAKWRIDKSGVSFVNGKRADTKHDVLQEGGFIKRHDGCQLDLAASTPDLLHWADAAASTVFRWRKASEEEAFKAWQLEETFFEEEFNENHSSKAVFLKPHQSTSCRGCWERKGTNICRRCNRVKYCSPECQKAHWPVHKQFCGKTVMELRNIWVSLLVELMEKGENMVGILQFVQHVGGDFWYNDKGHNIFHALASVPSFMQKFKSKRLREDFENVMKEGLDLGAELNAKCSTGDTPLHIACRQGSWEATVFVRFVLSCPTLDIDISNSDGAKAVDLCKRKDVQALISNEREARAESAKQAEIERLEIMKQKAQQKAEEREQQLAAQTRRERCRHCWNPGLFICRRCNNVKYCSNECQRNDWPIHRQLCGRPLLELYELLAGTVATVVNESDTKIDLAVIRFFLAHVGRDMRTDLNNGKWIMHTLADLISTLGLKHKLTNEFQREIECVLQDAVDFGMDVNAQNTDGDTALHMLCAQSGDACICAAVWLLTHAPVDLRIRNQAELTALDVCYKSGMRPENTEFTISLQHGGAQLGISTAGASEDGKPPSVTGITSDGLVQKWNADHADKTVEIGDLIHEVNGIVADGGTAWIDEIKQSQVLEMKLFRKHKILLDAFGALATINESSNE